MEKVIQEHLEKALIEFTSGGHYQNLLKAKKKFFELTGQINEEDEDYELRMNSFNDWYIFHYSPSEDSTPPISQYLQNKEIGPKIKDCLLSVKYSLYEFLGENFRKKLAFRDILHDQKIFLNKDLNIPIFLKDDIFVGRVLLNEEYSLLLGGVCLLPKEIKSDLKKQAKKIRKLKNLDEERKFLLNLESLKNRLVRFGHIGPKKIFYFDD